MATWQYSFRLVPKAVLEGEGILPSRLPESEAASLPIWPDSPALQLLRSRLDQVLGRGPAWHEDLEVWGEEQGNRIDVWTDSGSVAELIIRVDVRKDVRPFLAQVVRLAQWYRLVVLTEDHQIQAPSVEQLLLNVLRSDAFAFVEDPDAFLDGLRSRDEV